MAFYGHQTQIGRQLFGRVEGVPLQEDQEITAHLGAYGGNAGEESQIVFQAGISIDVAVDVLLQFGEF